MALAVAPTTIALSLGLKAAAPQALEAALSNLVLKSLYASDLHIDLRDYSYRFLLVLPCPKDLAAGAASTPQLPPLPVKQFKADVQAPREGTRLKFHLVKYYLDGIGVGCNTLPRSNPCFPFNVDGIAAGGGLYWPLQFTPVNLVGPDDYKHSDNCNNRICKDEQVIKSLGTIRITVTRCIAVLQRTSHADNFDKTQTTNQMNFSKRSKKARLATTAGLANEKINHEPLPEMVPQRSTVVESPSGRVAQSSATGSGILSSTVMSNNSSMSRQSQEPTDTTDKDD
ncbi:hypothetical protein PtB15_3B167 [Puccinia triticina]|nr:hypothetical protein PtB15_3B167 [Puccinia triticina]